MPIVLSDRAAPAYTEKFGQGQFVLSGGKNIKIETSPDGEEILSYDLPDGTWQLSISITIVKNE